MSSRLRVRSILAEADSAAQKDFKKLLPKDAMIPPTVVTHRYPAAILSALPEAERYSLLGCVTEDLLRSTAVSNEWLITTLRKWDPAITAENLIKILKSKTTDPFLEHVKTTRAILDTIVKGDLAFDTTVAYESVEGHPDAQTPTQLFEVKTTGMLEANWKDFLLQVFAYAALEPTATDIYLVLPLQEHIWHYDVTKWTNRVAFRDLLNTVAKRRLDGSVTGSLIPGMLLKVSYGIGSHMAKLKTLVVTIRSLPPAIPSQIFLSGPMNSRISLKEEDLVGGKALLSKAEAPLLFVHSPYMINLCSPPGQKDDYSTGLLIKYLEGSVKLGAKGVVVHVGKSTTQDLATAMGHMRTNLLRAMAYATVDCPILLETPAGQGSETLTDYDEFTEFVLSFKDPRLQICVDTCHVFASGYCPKDYVEGLVSTHPDALKLIHFNDSATPCGSCLDRHSFIGTGHIGIKIMTEIATICSSKKIPMLVE